MDHLKNPNVNNYMRIKHGQARVLLVEKSVRKGVDTMVRTIPKKFTLSKLSFEGSSGSLTPQKSVYKLCFCANAGYESKSE